jgi:hypothetical protein
MQFHSYLFPEALIDLLILVVSMTLLLPKAGG